MLAIEVFRFALTLGVSLCLLPLQEGTTLVVIALCILRALELMTRIAKQRGRRNSTVDKHIAPPLGPAGAVGQVFEYGALPYPTRLMPSVPEHAAHDRPRHINFYSTHSTTAPDEIRFRS